MLALCALKRIGVMFVTPCGVINVVLFHFFTFNTPRGGCKETTISTLHFRLHLWVKTKASSLLDFSASFQLRYKEMSVAVVAFWFV